LSSPPISCLPPGVMPPALPEQRAACPFNWGWCP
jgi:hypothetical protein